MTPEKRNGEIQSELHLLVAQKVLTYAEMQKIAERYPTGKWNLNTLVRWFTLLGAVCAGIGIILIVKDAMNIYTLLEILFGLFSILFILLGWWLKNEKKLEQTGNALTLISCFTLTGLTFTLGIHHSTGSGNWPALVGIDFVLFIIMSYLLNNRLVLIYACINFFTWFGGSTGYISGWGCYWLGMTYPIRFLVAGLCAIAFSYAHLFFVRKYAHFSRVYLHFGLLITNFALWFLALFGYFTEHVRWSGTEMERLLFSFVWACWSVASVYWGIRTNIGTFRSYGIVFIVINLYTFYFQFVAARSVEIWWIHLLLIGGSMILGGMVLERIFHKKEAATAEMEKLVDIFDRPTDSPSPTQEEKS